MSSTRTPILVIASGKGGVSKTTLTACLADFWAHKGLTVGALNTDPNMSLSRWLTDGQSQGNFKGVVAEEELQRDLIIDKARSMVDHVDVLIIDMAGLTSGSVTKAVGIADLVITPLCAGKDDVLEAVAMMNHVKDVSDKVGREIPCVAALTRCNIRTKAAKHAANQYRLNQFPMLKTPLQERADHQTARFLDTTPISLDPRSPACEDISNIAAEVEALLGMRSPLALTDATQLKIA